MCVGGGGGGGGWRGGGNALCIFTRHIGLGLGMSARDLQLTGCTQMLPQHHIPSCEESGHRTHFPCIVQQSTGGLEVFPSLALEGPSHPNDYTLDIHFCDLKRGKLGGGKFHARKGIPPSV